jgi:hypothetical protein
MLGEAIELFRFKLSDWEEIWGFMSCGAAPNFRLLLES